ncbi:MAG: Asp-tRNA(Asn)/Glu-tRNA(Gln) amidotransferase subunit GatC [Spartobacteria bacterium]
MKGGDQPSGTSATPALDVAYIARLARLELTAEETALFQNQLAQVLAHAEKLREVNVEGVEPAAQTFAIFDVWREDVARLGLTQEEALRNAPRSVKGLFIVPKVIE